MRKSVKVAYLKNAKSHALMVATCFYEVGGSGYMTLGNVAVISEGDV